MQNQYGRDALYGRTFVYMYASFIYNGRVYIYCILYSSKHELPYYCWACEDIHTHTIHSSGVLLVYSNRVQLNVKNDVSIRMNCDVLRQYVRFPDNTAFFKLTFHCFVRIWCVVYKVIAE